MLILSLFPGIGLLDMAFEEQGFCVVRGPDVLWGGNIKGFHAPMGRFDGIIGGPPCQRFSAFRHICESKGVAKGINLIPEFVRCVLEAQSKWFLMENVVKAPEPEIKGYAVKSFIINNRWVGGIQNRLRRFSFGLQGKRQIDLRKYIEFSALENIEWQPTVCASGSTKPGAPRDRMTRLAYSGWKTAEALKASLRLQGLPENHLDDAPFTLQGKHRVIGNGVALPVGRAIARAVVLALKEA